MTGALAPAVAALAAALLGAGCGGSSDDDPRAKTPTEPGGGAATQPTAAAPSAINADGVTEHLRALQRIADRNGGTRAAGTNGDRETADYIAGRLRATGWTVRFQTVRFPFFAERGRPVLDDLHRGRDFDVLEYSPGGSVTARVRPLDTPGCDEAALAPVSRGEIAMVARGTCTFRRKAISAQRAGAAALLVVDRRGSRPAAGTLGRPSGLDIPVIAVTGGAASRLARTTRPVRLRVETVSEQRETRNVLAETAPATGAGAKTVMAGAHLDSVEEGPGINDNGSGIAALLEAAERLADRPGLRLGFWGAEELGLYGSRHYVRGLDRQRRRGIAAYLNLDMVGSPKPRAMVYDTDDAVERTLRRALPGAEGEITIGAASDHAPFQSAGIRVGGYFTGASAKTDPCYHRRCDTIRNVDTAMAARMARATLTALSRLRPR